MSVKSAAPTPPASRRQVLILGGLLAVLAVLVLTQVLPMFGSGGAPAAPPQAASSAPPASAPAASAPGAAGAPAASQGGRRGAAGANGKGGPVEEVALAKLQQPWPEPTTSRRNPFTMTAEPPPAPPPGPPPKPVEPVAQVPTGPPPPPPIPPITLKFIGTVTGPSHVGKIAALTDGKFVYKGKEGEVVEGRYRIVKIGEESIQIEYANGTGRQTIRLSGK